MIGCARRWRTGRSSRSAWCRPSGSRRSDGSRRGSRPKTTNPRSASRRAGGSWAPGLRETPKGGGAMDSRERSEVCSDALIGAERILRIVNDFRLFSRLDSEPQKLVDLREGLDHALSGASYNLGKAQVVRDFQDVPPVGGSEQGLEQVFMGLLNNAGYATKNVEDPRVSIIARQREEGWVMVEVRDNGVGIAPEHVSRIFDPFFTTKPRGTGTGLGLSICYGIVSGLGGSIEVDSTPGKGSTFRVKLPRVPEHAATV